MSNSAFDDNIINEILIFNFQLKRLFFWYSIKFMCFFILIILAFSSSFHISSSETLLTMEI